MALSPASSSSSGSAFNGGTITGETTIALAANPANAALNLAAPTSGGNFYGNLLRFVARDGTTEIGTIDWQGDVAFQTLPGSDGTVIFDTEGGTRFAQGNGSMTLSGGTTGTVNIRAGGLLVVQAKNPAGTQQLGLFGVTPAAQPVVTSATATPEQLALALQSYGALGGT